MRTITSPGVLINLLFFQNKPELWQMGIIGAPLLTDKSPQLLAKVCIPLSGLILVPSGNSIMEKPF